ncbi:MAG: PIG-L family deacetylase [Ferruginibacter sp.]
MKHHFLLILCCLFLIPFAYTQQKSKTILGIFPHPDDENMIGHVFAKYARLGHRVYVIIATDGKDGTRVTKIPAGDSLGKLRQQESICACKKLGIDPPIFLSFARLDTKFGVRPYLNAHKQLMDSIKKYLEQLKPDVLITFGPDGEYGHSEHIVTGATVVDLLLREGWVDKYPLYFPVDKKEDFIPGGDISYVDDRYMNVAVTYSVEDERKLFEAAKCYVTQTTAAEIQELVETVSADTKKTKYFRRFTVMKGIKSELWD